jgi:GTP-dependent dephospho-CoA kinase
LPDAYVLPDRLRSRLAKPLGRFFTADEVKGTAFARLVTGSEMVVTVGDKVTETAFALGRTPDVQVVDGVERRMKREPPDVPYATLIRVKNPAGALTKEAIMGVRAAFMGKKPARVLVDGEEDLVAIPVIAEAPSTAVVFYGQPGEGIVAVKPDASTKARNRAILAEMGITETG